MAEFKKPTPAVAKSVATHSISCDAVSSSEGGNDVFENCEDEEIEFDAEDMKKDSSGAVGYEEFAFEVLGAGQILEHMNDCVSEVGHMLQLPKMTVWILMNHFRWDREKLLDRYFGSNSEQLFQEAKVFSSHAVEKYGSSWWNREVCQICLESSSRGMLYGMKCGHGFCLQCWSEYLNMKIMDAGTGPGITCAAHMCPVAMDDDSVMRLLKDDVSKERYQLLVTNNFVQCHKRMRWCPAPGCANAIRVEYSDCKPVTCACGFKFCYQCANVWHGPVLCSVVQDWLQKCQTDFASSQWISTNTKDCPNCKAPIEKNGGCNHMVCGNQNCRTEFCWTCARLWGEHLGNDGYRCNGYRVEGGQANNVSKPSPNVSRAFFFHYKRYTSHMESVGKEKDLYTTAKEKLELINSSDLLPTEELSLKDAVKTLRDCRYTLMYSNVFAFYHLISNPSFLFEFNQQELQTATEGLSRYLERDINDTNFDQISKKVDDCKNRQRIFLEYVYEGYESDQWTNTVLPDVRTG